MPDFAQWSEAERDQFSHELERLLHGPNPTRKIGFILVGFPIGESTRANVLSNCDNRMVLNVCVSVAEGLMKTKGKLPYVG